MENTKKGFVGDTILKRENRKVYILQSQLSFESEKYKITIKEGLKTDGASIPKWLWSFIGCPFNGKYVGSAIIHDALYQAQITTKKEADKIFLDLMRDNEVSKIKSRLMYLAVKFFGKSAWTEKTPNKEVMEIIYNNES